MKNTCKITAIILLLSVNIINAQDVRYSQVFTNPLTLNPALMNINDQIGNKSLIDCYVLYNWIGSQK